MSAAVKGPWFDVPARTRASRCRSCGQSVFWIRTAAGKPMPVDCSVEGGRRPVPGDTMAYEPIDPEDGRGISHFATCKHADQWRKR